MGEHQSLEVRAFGIYREALEINDEALRSSFVADACDGDDTLLAEVLALLTAASQAPASLGENLGVRLLEWSTFRSGEMLGSYQVIRRLGEGGMGEVYLAEQPAPKRLVAVKILKPGLDFGAFLTRFEREKEVLAQLDHPYVAKIHDAGSDPSGRPFFVMEYVEGLCVTDFCHQHRLDLKARIHLFLKICKGIQHAHQNGVIHRDIKPNNILISGTAMDPVPKVIDFGIAKAIGGLNQTIALPGERSVAEESPTRSIVGTLEYMSPEQVTVDGSGVDVRTDVFQLGLLFYQLLTDSLPLEAAELQSLPLDEALRIVREAHFSKPSRRVQRRGLGTGSNSLRETLRVLQGDVDLIVMKALDREKENRYPSVGALAQDIRCYLDYEPVSASPPSLGYRLAKMARRHRMAVVFSLLTLAMLLAGLAGTARGLVLARQEAARAKLTVEILQQFLASADPEVMGKDIKVTDLLHNFSKQFDVKTKGDAHIKASLHHTFAQTYLGLGHYEEAEQHAQHAVALRKQTLGTNHVATMESEYVLAGVFKAQTKFQEAVTLTEDVLSRAKRIGRVPPQLLLGLESDQAFALTDLGQYEKALALFEKALARSKQHLGPDHESTLRIMNEMAYLLKKLGHYQRSVTMQQAVVDSCRRVFGGDDPRTLVALNVLATIFTSMENYAEAEHIFSQLLVQRTEVLGDDHPSTLLTLSNLGYVLCRRGRLEEAENLHRQCLAKRRRALGEDNPRTLDSLYNLADTLVRRHRYEEAELLLLNVFQARTKVLGENHPATLLAGGDLADVWMRLGRLDESLRLQGPILERARTHLGLNSGITLQALNRLARLQWRRGDSSAAEPLLRESFARHRDKHGDNHKATVHCFVHLVLFLHESGDPGAQALLGQALAQLEGLSQADDELKTRLVHAMERRDEPAAAGALTRAE